MSKSAAAAYAKAQDSTTKIPSKQAPKLPVITIVPDANPTCPIGRREPAAAAARQQALNTTGSTWNASFCDCCCSVAPTYCCIVTCCPCTTIASVKESLGGGYERTLLYFGGLALGLLVSIGFAASNNSEEPADRPVGPAGPPPPTAPPQHAGSGNLILWQAFAALFLMTFLFGVWRLRMQTRHCLGIQGSLLNDCLSSFLCCFCVISQLHLELKCHHEESATARQTQYRGRGDTDLASTRPVDTLAPYAVM
ncbi:hypothetical protein PHYPSEUDO_009799 [Phytophthora pseudosyringae]|uniref:Transmembrane protein n=1 Tax=Phytophthora pseudosyringae TaxID=221518 RepID=A0A8T1VGP8_9STRA|nr:hypothetical protein PHYPSEUDO_009799 [Phytophthora pseudosyringae]